MHQEVSDDKLIHILKSLGLDKFANRASLDEFLTEDGANLSGGEKREFV